MKISWEKEIFEQKTRVNFKKKINENYKKQSLKRATFRLILKKYKILKKEMFSKNRCF